MSVYEQVKQALEDVVAPELKALQVEIKRLDEKVDNRFSLLDDKIDSLRREVASEIKRLDDKIDTAIQIRERLASLEAKLASMGN